jgi:multifunctional beta-oxidation protein
MCLYGLGKALAKEGLKTNVFCNMIAPVAGTRITETVLPQEILSKIKPEFISPFVALLCHETSSINGSTFEVGGGFFSCVRPQIANGPFFDSFDDLKNYFAHSKSIEGNKNLQERIPNEENLDINLKDKVAVITGASNRIGEKFSKLLAQLGTTVILIDSAKNSKGESLVDIISKEINKKGGKSHYISLGVLETDKILEKIKKSFKKIDILINNTNFDFEKPFGAISDSEWEQAFNVNLNETYLITKLFFNFFSTQKYGKIINISSPASLIGNIDHTSYSSSKAGIWGLTKTLYLEFKKFNIDIGIVSPLFDFGANERNIVSEQIFLKFLTSVCREKIKMNGEFFIVGDKKVESIKMARSKLFRFQENEPSQIAKKIDSFSKMENISYPKDAQTSFLSFVQAVGDHNKNSGIEASMAKKIQIDDIIRYHLSVGFTHNDLEYIYENSSNFKILLTFSTTFIYDFLPKLDFNAILDSFKWVNLLHLGQSCQLIKKIEPGSVIKTNASISACKKSSTGSIVSLKIASMNEKEEVVFTNEVLLYIKMSKPKKEFGDINRPNLSFNSFDEICDLNISENSAALFRLSGDKNPLHM